MDDTREVTSREDPSQLSIDERQSTNTLEKSKSLEIELQLKTIISESILTESHISLKSLPQSSSVQFIVQTSICSCAVGEFELIVFDRIKDGHSTFIHSFFFRSSSLISEREERVDDWYSFNC